MRFSLKKKLGNFFAGSKQGVQLTLCVEYVRLKRFPETMHDLRLLSLTAHCVVLFYISGKNTLTTNKLFIR